MKMQPKATLALAMVWLVMCTNVESLYHLRDSDSTEIIEDQNFQFEKQPFLGTNKNNKTPQLLGYNPRPRITDEEANRRDTENPKSAPPEPSPPSELDDSFVADDTFQDQGPGSVEIYKLDLLRVKSLLNPTAISRFLSNGKSKVPKKISHVNYKTKITSPSAQDKATSPKMLYKQSNSFDDSSTEVPPNTDPFSIGGVPELQMGCEGMQGPFYDFRKKRSIDSPGRDKKSRKLDPWTNITPISLDLDYDLSDEEGYEEIDELLKLKKLEIATKGEKRNRGDMEPSLHSDFHDDKKASEKLPVRGDLGKSSVNNDTVQQMTKSDHSNQGAKGKETSRFDKGRRVAWNEAKFTDSLASGVNQRRKILWIDNSGVDEQPDNEGRTKRSMWGFGEDEGVVSSNELETQNQRRRQAYEKRRKEEEERRRQEEERRKQEIERRRQEEQRRNYVENRTISDIDKIREEYERSLQEREREEEERRRRLEKSQRSPPNRWQQEEEQRRRLHEEESRRNRWQDEERRRQELEASRRRSDSRPQIPTSYEEERKRLQQEEEETRRREANRLLEQERLQRLQIEEERRKAESRWQEEMRRRNQQELDRRNLEERRREWMLKQKQEQEEERRRQQGIRNEPSNLLHPSRGTLNDSRPYDTETERRMREQEEAERQRKLNEYIQRNQPINTKNSLDQQREEEDRRTQEEERRRLEEERKVQEYIRRNQPVRVSKLNESYDSSSVAHRRPNVAGQYNRARYPAPGSGRRNHGPSAPTNIDPRSYVDEAKRREAARRIEEERIHERQRQQQEQLRWEALRREEEVRSAQSRRYEEQRRRQEAARLEAERRAKEQLEEEARRSQSGRTGPLVNTRPSYEDRRRFEEHRRRQDTSLIPANLLSNESRRAKELERQRQEQERRRLETERRRQENNRAKEARENEQRTRAMKEQLRRQEETRLNALPVSARIIVRPAASSSITPNVLSRMGSDSDTDIDFPGINPYRPGIPAPNFSPSSSRRPLVKSPPPCVWAVVTCCPTNTNRLVTCFESMGCPGINWDPMPCRSAITQAARKQVMRFYAEVEEEEQRFKRNA